MKKSEQKLLSALIGLARASYGNEPPKEADSALLAGLRAFFTQEADEARQKELLEQVTKAKGLLSPGCASCQNPCQRNADYDFADFYEDGPETAAAKGLLLSSLFVLAAAPLPDVGFLYRALEMVGVSCESAHLSSVLQNAGLRAAALLAGEDIAG